MKYYEQLLEDGGSGSDGRKFAAERLVRNLERHAEYLRYRRDDIRRAAIQESRARSLRREERLGARTIDAYPVVETTSDDAEAVTTWQFGPFEIVRSRAHERFRIEHLELFETVTVDTLSRTLRGDADFSRRTAAGKDTVSWRIADWNLVVELTTSTDDTLMKVDHDGNLFEARMGDGRRETER